MTAQAERDCANVEGGARRRPGLDVDYAKNVFVIKRSMNPGFAGIQNPLFFKDNTMMVFGDAKKVMIELAEAVRKY